MKTSEPKAASQHTPGPWKYTAAHMAGDYPPLYYEVRKDNGEKYSPQILSTWGPGVGNVLKMQEWKDSAEQQRADAEFVVTACNSHAALLIALEAVNADWSEAWPDGPDGGKGHDRVANIAESTRIVWRQIRAAIKLARGES